MIHTKNEYKDWEVEKKDEKRGFKALVDEWFSGFRWTTTTIKLTNKFGLVTTQWLFS